MKKRLTMFLACLFLSLGMAMAQTHVTGVVISAEDNQPVIGAFVKVLGTSDGTQTDLDGKFELNVPAGAMLEFSYVGMNPKKVKAAANMHVVLESDNKTMQEVVVVGYGSAKKIGSITGSITTVNADKLKNAPSSSALDALQGQVAGLNVLSSSGEAGDNAVSMNIHGKGSIGASSTPLYVIDGIPSSSRAIMAMNPNDIKNISVLKDASATSIYGSRAANGVIYVTTKNGSFNSKARITFRSQFGISTPADKRLYHNMMNASELREFWGKLGYTKEDIDKAYTWKDRDGNEHVYNGDTRWWNHTMQFNNPQTQNDLSIEGGSDRISYMVGAGQFHQRGAAIGNFYDRYNFRSNLSARPKDWMRMGINVAFSYDKKQRNANFGNSEGNAQYTSGGLSFLLSPLYPAIDPATGKDYAKKYPGVNMTNPYYAQKNSPDVYERYGVLANAFIELEPIKNLKIRSRLGSDMYFILDNWKTNASYEFSSHGGVRGKSSTFGYSNTITNTIEYSFNLNDDHHFTVLGGQEGVKNNYDYFYAQSTGQIDDHLMLLQNGKKESYGMGEEGSESRFLSFLGRIDYDYANRYFLDFSLRNDASSRFGANHKNAAFWAAGVLWKIKNEAFMNEYKWIDDLNFKVSYGTQGNSSIGDYGSLGLIGATTNYDTNASWVYAQHPNPELTWEKQKMFSVTLDGKLFHRLDFELMYYIRKTTNMLMGVPYPYTTGYSSLVRNVGGLQNSGIDVKLGYDILRGRDYYLRAGINFNYNNDKVTELFQGRQRWEIANTLVAYVVGKPVMYYLPIWAGVNPADGSPQWYLPGKNIDETTKDKSRVTSNFDETVLTQNSGHRRYAPFNGGFNISAGWKGLTLSADFAVVLGKYLANNDMYFYANFAAVQTAFNQHKMVNDFWREDNKNAKFPDWRKGYGMHFDSHLLENASFMRLKSLQIGYVLPKSLLAWQNVVEGLKFTFTGRNLFTITDYTGIDPEVDTNVSLGRLGNTRQILFGVEVTF